VHGSLLRASAAQLSAPGARGVGFVASACMVATLLQAGGDTAVAAFDALAPLLPTLAPSGTSDGVIPLLAAAVALTLQDGDAARCAAAAAAALDAIRSVAASPSSHPTASDSAALLGAPGAAAPILRAMQAHAAGDAARLPACMKTAEWRTAVAALLVPTVAPEDAQLAPQLLRLLADDKAELYAPQLLAAMHATSPVRGLFSGGDAGSAADAQLLSAWRARRQASLPRNSWSSSAAQTLDGVDLLRVTQRGAAVRPLHPGGGGRNGIMRARRGYSTGAHFWTVTLTEHSVEQQPQAAGGPACFGSHAVGVVAAPIRLEVSTSPTHLLGSMSGGWALVTHNTNGRNILEAMADRHASDLDSGQRPARCAACCWVSLRMLRIAVPGR
jgi:hypothetical protein